MGKEAKYVVRLTMEERGTLESLVAAGRAAADKLLRARMLLKANVGQAGPGWRFITARTTRSGLWCALTKHPSN
jgi:hypothetical protein